MAVSKTDQINALLNSIETANSGPVAVVNEDKYIQHNPQTHEGVEGLAQLFARFSKTNPKGKGKHHNSCEAPIVGYQRPNKRMHVAAYHWSHKIRNVV